MKIHELSVQHILRSQRSTRYKCIPQLAVIPAVRSTNIRKIKPVVYLHICTVHIPEQSNMSADMKTAWGQGVSQNAEKSGQRGGGFQ